MAPNTVVYIAALCAFSGASALRQPGAPGSTLPTIRGESYNDMFARGVDKKEMVKYAEKSFDHSNENITIMGYDASEDKEISGALQLDSEWEPHHTWFICEPWQKEHKRGNFLDIGTNIGTYSLPVAKCIEKEAGTVLSVEAMPVNADHFRAGVLANKATNVRLYPYAVGAPNGPDFITMTLDPKNKGGSSVEGNKADALAQTGVKEFKVRLTTIDEMVRVDPRFKAVLFAKVDIEGNEGRMIQGAEEFFSKHPPCHVNMELVGDWLEAAGTPVKDILEKFEAWGYVTNRRTRKMPDPEWMAHAPWRVKTIHAQQYDLKGCYERVDKEFALLEGSQAKAHLKRKRR